MALFVGVDVGSNSARACLMDDSGVMRAQTEEPILKWEPEKGIVNQSSANIWRSVCKCVQRIVLFPNEVKAIAFGATCSLVVNDSNGEPCSVGPDFGNTSQDIIMWMDQRATKEAQFLNRFQHPLMKFVGGSMSVEMELPRILWLKNNKRDFGPQRFFDLNEWLVWRSTGIFARSLGSITGKQGYLPIDVDGVPRGWCTDFFCKVGLSELCSDDCSDRRLGKVCSAGKAIGRLTPQASRELGLDKGVTVASSVIDAYAGWIGTVGTTPFGFAPGFSHIGARLATIAGTSTCHILVSDDPIHIPGTWGPYFDALIPGMWCTDSGQNATGKALEYLLENHPAARELEELSAVRGQSVFRILNDKLEDLRRTRQLPTICHLAKDIFWYGDLCGNRTPYNDPEMCGSVTGISMDTSLDDLAIQYLAAVEFLCFQMRQIVDSLGQSSRDIQFIYLSGGQCKNTLISSMMATVLELPTVIPENPESAVLRGTAILAANAGLNGSLWHTMRRFAGHSQVVKPQVEPSLRRLLRAKYEIFLDQAEVQRKYRRLVCESLKHI